MKQNIITETIPCDRVVEIIAFVGIPVSRELLRAQYEDSFVAVFIILDHRKSREGLTETDAVSENTTVVFFQLIDDCETSLTLEVIQHLPDLALLEAGGFVGQHILGNVFQKLVEDIVQTPKKAFPCSRCPRFERGSRLPARFPS